MKLILHFGLQSNMGLFCCSDYFSFSHLGAVSFFLFRLIFNWKIIALQYCVGFCHISTWISHQFSSVQSLSRVWLFRTPWTTACQASLSITNSWSPRKPMSIESLMPSNYLILCCPLLLLLSIFSNIKVFSNESALHIRWLKYWNFKCYLALIRIVTFISWSEGWLYEANA